MSKHTPGPWWVQWQNPCHWVIRHDGVHLPPGNAADDPNRLLIERAPETKKQRDQLLWALEYVSTELRDARSADLDGFNHELLLRVVDSAIDKAKGEV